MISTETIESEATDNARGAVISPCGRYRYRLWRRWGAAPAACFIMLNPSTADADVDDPTIRRCIAFAKRWGCGGIRVVNLFAWRATDPAALVQARRDGFDIAGAYNHVHLVSATGDAGRVIAAWGAHPLARDRWIYAARWLRPGTDVACLGTTKDGSPRHPLYVRGDTNPVAFATVGDAIGEGLGHD